MRERAPKLGPDTPLYALGLSSRLLTWADARGVDTVGQLAVIDPRDLLESENLGRASVAQARAAIKRALGVEWDHLLPKPAALRRSRSPRGSSPVLPGSPPERLAMIASNGGWDRLRRALSLERRATPLSFFPFSYGTREYLAKKGFKTLGEFADDDAFLESHADPSYYVVAYFTDPVATIASLRRSYLDGFRAWVNALDENTRAMMQAHSGLEELRTRFARHAWGQRAIFEVRRALADGAACIRELRDPFWSGVGENAREAAHAADLIAPPVRLVRVDGELWLSRRAPEDVDRARAPAETTRLDRHSELLYFLARSPVPLTVEDPPPLAEMPSEVVLFAANVIGLERHFSFYRELQASLGPAVRDLIHERGGDRRWKADFLLEELRRTRELPSALTPHVLWSMLRSHPALACVPPLDVRLDVHFVERGD
jgi:hypothetical protein